MRARLGELLVDESASCLLQPGGARLAVSPKVVELLVQLGHSGGRPVRREVLVRDLWPEKAVGDKALSMLVVEARRQLARHFDGRNPICTVPRVGYSLALDYELCDAPLLAMQDEGTGQHRLVVRVAAPKILSAGAARAGKCLHDTLLNALSSEPGLAVRTKETLYEPPAAKKVALVVHSSVRMIARDVLFTVRCVTQREKLVCWASSERAPLSRAFDAETRLCERLRDELRVAAAGCGLQTWRQYRLSRGFDALVEGQRLVSARKGAALRAARTRFRHALLLDPDCAPALVGMADCEMLSAWYGGVDADSAAQRATAFAEQALALNADLAAAHCTRGLIYLVQLRFAKAEQELREAIRLDDSNAIALQWYADFLATQGCMREAVQFGYRAVARAAGSTVVNSQLGQLLHMAGLFDEAQAQLERVLVRDPACASAHCFLALNLAMSGDPAAIGPSQRAVELSPNTPFFRGAYGSVLARLGDGVKALQQLHALEAGALRAQPFAEAAMMVATALGQPKRGIEWFRVATERSAAWALYGAALPILASMRNEPAFQSVVRSRGMAIARS